MAQIRGFDHIKKDPFVLQSTKIDRDDYDLVQREAYQRGLTVTDFIDQVLNSALKQRYGDMNAQNQ